MFDNPDDAQAWEDALWEAFRQKDLAEWLPRLLGSPDVAFEISATSEEGLEHPQIVHNGDVITIEDPTVGPVRQVGPIGHFSATPMGPRRSAPSLGSSGGALRSRSGSRRPGTAPRHPLEGTTIVEFGYYYAMPYALAMAAALGARVIKLEHAEGDPHRMSFGPDVASNKTTAGKESVSLDLRTDEGKAIAKRIIAKADVFVNSFRSGVADRLGLGYEELADLNPRLLYVHASGYGSDGPLASRALYAQAAQTVAGSFGRQVGYWADPIRNVGMSIPELQLIIQPRVNQITDGDSNASLSVLASVVLGVYHQRRTGVGQLLRTSMISGNAWCYSDDFCSYSGKRPIPVCESEYYGTSALERVYRTAEGWVCLVVRTDHEFTLLARGLGHEDLISDSRFADSEQRHKHDADLIKTIEGLLTTRSAAEWEELLSALDVGCVEVNMKGQPFFTSFDPVLRETGLTVEIDHPMYGTLVVAAPPIRFSETPGRTGLPCFRGQHNSSVLGEFGFSAQEIEAFETSGVLFPESAWERPKV
jgi:crotonobetainyl-CoA:carnitine CoA-transferase CaiB-like acyl-CoA transferase